MNTLNINSSLPTSDLSAESREDHSMLAHEIEEIIRAKRENLNQVVSARFQGTNCVKEAIYIGSDVGTVGFSLVKGVSAVANVAKSFILVGGIGGLVGGVLDIGQGIFLILESLKFLGNQQYKQFARILIDGLMLAGIGIAMTLSSLLILGVSLGILTGFASFAANPYFMPIFIIVLVLPGLIQTMNHLMNVSKGTDLGSKLHNNLALQHEHIQELLRTPEKDRKRKISDLMERYTEDLGVYAGIDALELMQRFLENKKNDELRQAIEKSQESIRAWNRMIKLRITQFLLYLLTFPLGIASATVSASTSRTIDATSRFFLTAPSSLGTYMDVCKPFERNGALCVPKVVVT